MTYQKYFVRISRKRNPLLNHSISIIHPIDVQNFKIIFSYWLIVNQIESNVETFVQFEEMKNLKIKKKQICY